jgi:hypothetical protein
MDNYPLMNKLRLVSLSGDLTTLDEVGFTNTLAGVNVQWQQINNLEIATSAVVAPDTANIFAVNNTFEANDNYLAKTRTAVLSAPPLVEPSLTLTNITTGDNSVLTTQTLTLNESLSTNSAVLNGNGTLVLVDNGNGSVISLTPDSGLGINVLPLPSSKYVNLDAYAGLVLNNTIVDTTATLTSNNLTITDLTSGDNNSLTAFNLTFNEILNGKTGVFGAGGAVITESSDSTSLTPTGMTITKVGDTTMTFGFDNITHYNIANADKMYINSNAGIRLQIDGGGAGIIYLDENYLTIACENINISSGIDFIIGCNATGINVNQQQDAPLVLYENDFPGAGFAVGVPTIEYYKSGRNTTAGDIICSQKFYAKNYAGVKTLFSKIEASVRNTSAGNDDGAVGIFATLNGVMSEFFRFNGADGENNTFYPIDLNNQAIKSSTGNINITANSSTGTGNITLTPKATGSLILNNLPTSAVGLPTGAVWNNLGVLSIA